MMLKLVQQLIGLRRENPAGFREALPILKAILHSEALTLIVQGTKSPVDDLVLQVLRALIPKD